MSSYLVTDLKGVNDDPARDPNVFRPDRPLFIPAVAHFSYMDHSGSPGEPCRQIEIFLRICQHNPAAETEFRR
jgi:hypothetical protein